MIPEYVRQLGFGLRRFHLKRLTYNTGFLIFGACNDPGEKKFGIGRRRQQSSDIAVIEAILEMLLIVFETNAFPNRRRLLL